jgi:hypothetical protein
LGRAIGSLSYTVPIGESFSFTVAFGASRRKLIELELPADDFSTDQIQEFGQLEWEFSESLSQRWSLVLGLSAAAAPPSSGSSYRQQRRRSSSGRKPVICASG